jgi:hypothetical protein
VRNEAAPAGVRAGMDSGSSSSSSARSSRCGRWCPTTATPVLATTAAGTPTTTTTEPLAQPKGRRWKWMSPSLVWVWGGPGMSRSAWRPADSAWMRRAASRVSPSRVTRSSQPSSSTSSSARLGDLKPRCRRFSVPLADRQLRRDWRLHCVLRNGFPAMWLVASARVGALTVHGRVCKVPPRSDSHTVKRGR